MPNIPKKVAERLSKQLGIFKKILQEAKKRDVNESDTVTIITDMLSNLFGFNKYTEITSELAIHGKYCDLAVKLDGAFKYLIEVKAIGLTMKENHLHQAIHYGATQGIHWVVLTNGINWEIYRIKFERPLDCELTCSFDILELNPRTTTDIERLFLLCREGLVKDAIDEYHKHTQNVNRFVIAAIMQSDPVLDVLRREIRRLEPTMKVSIDEIVALLPDVLKRDVIEGDSATQAIKRVKKSSGKVLKKTQQIESVATTEQDLSDSADTVT